MRGQAAVFIPADSKSAAQHKQDAPILYTGAASPLGNTTIPILPDTVATTPHGPVAVDAATPEQVQRNLAAAQAFLTEKAAQEQAAGNTTFAQELREGAQYTGECLKTLGQCTAQNFCAKNSTDAW